MSNKTNSLKDLANIVILKDAASYTMWAFHIKIAFEANDLLKIVDGTLSQEDVVPGQAELWKESDAMAKLFILNTTDVSVKRHLFACSTSKEMFDKLRTIYEKDSEYQVNHLLQEMYSYKWDKNMSALDNISSVQQIAFQLTGLDQEVNETAVMSKITSILPKEYSAFSTAWDSVPAAVKTLDNLCARLQIEESKINAAKEELVPVPVTALHAGRRDVKSRLTCNKCKKKGHIAKDCRTKKACKYCKRTNHKDDDCYFKNKRYCAVCKRTNHYESECFKKRRNRNENRQNSNRGQTDDRENEENGNANDNEGSGSRVCFLAYNKRGGSPHGSQD